MAAGEEFVDSTIASLKIIGMVPRSGKLCVRKGQLSLDNPDNGQAVRRWLRGDSRDLTLMHARNTINSAVKISKSLMANYQSTELAGWTLERLVNEMEQCEVGLQNLKTTYACDSMMVANLDVLADRLRAHKCEVRKFESASEDDGALTAAVSAECAMCDGLTQTSKARVAAATPASDAPANQHHSNNRQHSNRGGSKGTESTPPS